jgi:hypothetical protein
MIRLVKRITADISAGKHVESYIVTAVALAIAILGLIDDAIDIGVQLSIILAALGLLVFKLTEPEAREIDLDQVLKDRQGYGSFGDFIHGGKVLWVYGPSAVNVLTNPSTLENKILNNGGEIRVILQDPTVETSIEILKQQLDNTTAHLLPDDIKRSVAVLETMIARGSRIQYRFLSYSPGYSLAAVDPDGRDGRLVVEFFGFNNQMTDNRMHIEIRRQQTRYWFDHWTDQFEEMWKAARDPNGTIGGA